MRDVEHQLAAYFDATVERITAEDVLAGVHVRHALEETTPATPMARLRPAWALAVAFGTTIVVISGSLGVGLLLRARSAPPGTGGIGWASPAATNATPWFFVVGAAVVLVAIALIAATRTRVAAHSRRGGTTMTTTVEPSPVKDRTHELESRIRTLTIVVVVLAILAIGLGAWAIYQATSSADELSAPDEVMAMTDDWMSALEQHDGSVVDLYVFGGTHLYGTETFKGDALARHLGGAEGQVEIATHEWTADPVVMVSGEDRWVVVRPMHIVGGSTDTESTLSYEIVRLGDGSYKIAQSAWLVDHDHVLYTSGEATS